MSTNIQKKRKMREQIERIVQISLSTYVYT